MKPPSLRVLLLGHPLTVLLVLGLAVYRCWLCYLDATNGTVFLAGASIWLLWRALLDFDQRRRHRAWRRDCMAIAGENGGAKGPRWRLLAALVPGLWVAVASQSNRPGAMIALGIGVVVAALAVFLIAKFVAIVWRLSHRERATTSRPVSVAISRPLLPVPSLQQAYRSLPPYCAALLKGRS